MSRSEYYPGRRLSFSGALCTVRYVGLIEGTKGEWLGLEWDESSKGKHNGSHNGVRYFECCSASPTAASFIRPSRPSDRPDSFFEALKKKYASSSAEDFTATADEIHIGGKTVEEVGFEKIQRQLAELQELRIVVLDGACIATVGSDLGEQNLKTIELDLSGNLFESWSDITTICNSLNLLRSLRLDGNTFSRPQDPFKNDWLHKPYGRLKELSLNKVAYLQQKTNERNENLPWEFVINFTAIFPSLIALSLASNNLTDITLPLTTPTLTKIDLSSNAFTTLQHIRPLAALPNLQSLSLRANPFTSLSSSPNKRIVFPKLKHLDLTSTLLPTLPPFNPIPLSFPELTSLLTTHTPLTTYPSASLHTIARLATLTELNYSPITPPERQNAELYYISQISKHLAAATNDTQERETLAQHPRWKELCDIHGEPTITRSTAAEAADAGTLAARVTLFTFHINSQDLRTAQQHAKSIAGHSVEPTAARDPEALTSYPTTVERKKLIPRTVSIYRLKGIVAQLFAIRPVAVRLIWESEEWDPMGADERGWSVSEEEEEEEDDDDEEEKDGNDEEEKEDYDNNNNNDDPEQEMKNEKNEKNNNNNKNQNKNKPPKKITPSSKKSAKSAVKKREKKKNKKNKKNQPPEKEAWQKREIELVDGMRAVGFFLEGTEARVRVEVR